MAPPTDSSSAPRSRPAAVARLDRHAEMLRELRKLESEPARLLAMSRPSTAALLLASTRTITELEARKDDRSRPAIVAMAEMAILAAANGSARHLEIINDRLEGRSGLRPGDVPSDRGEVDVGQAIEDAITRMTEARLAMADNEPPIIEGRSAVGEQP